MTAFYIPLFLFALLKDLSDLLTIGPLWIVGAILSLCCGALIALFLPLTGASQWQKKAIVLIAVTIMEMMPILNVLPAETVAVTIMHRIDQKAKKRERKEKNEKSQGEEFEDDALMAY